MKISEITSCPLCQFKLDYKKSKTWAFFACQECKNFFGETINEFTEEITMFKFVINEGDQFIVRLRNNIFYMIQKETIIPLPFELFVFPNSQQDLNKLYDRVTNILNFL